MAIILRVRSMRSAAEGMRSLNLYKGVSGWGMYGPSPTIATSICLKKSRSAARWSSVWKGRPTITPVPV